MDASLRSRRARKCAFLVFLPIGMAYLGPVTAARARTTVATLPTMVVTATGNEQALSHAPASMTVISGEQLESRPYATIADVLRDVPGVVLSTNAGFGRSGAQTISIRGLSDSYVLLMVDGRPIGNSPEASYDGFGTGIAASYLPPPSAIERIEVIRGPMSSLYGSSALGGVINIITKPVASVWSGELTAGTTIHDASDEGKSYESRFSLSGPLAADRLGLTLFGAVNNRFDHVLTDRSIQDVKRDSIGAKLRLKVNADHSATLEAMRNGHRTDNNGRVGGIDSESLSSALTHRIKWGRGYETSSFLNHEDVDFTRNLATGTQSTSGYSQTNLNSKTRIVLGQHALTVGGDYRSEETRHSANRFANGVDSKLTRWHGALFAEDNWHLLDTVSATLGLRYDENERYGSQLTPRVYGIWDATHAVVVKGGITGGYKVPQLKQADSGLIESAGSGRGWDQGNTDLQPEESINYEVGALWTAGGGAKLGLTAYHTQFKNKIDRQNICTSNAAALACMGRQYIAQYVNRDEAELNGVEATFDMTVQRLDISVNYTYSESKITKGAGEGNPFNNLPRNVVNLGLTWRISDALSLWSRSQVRSKTIDTGNLHVPGHVVADIGLGYKLTSHVRANLAIYNLGDRTVGNDYMDGRRYFVSLNTRF